ncbi:MULTISPECIES: Crp/Fnr family transcriptional regulator [unclassified Brevundimonas]|uniref:Crp/Fnr family transcriptional regulator n=1 Tax=unclassified Brevundimonas TaxID=2622653 RepID=UPI0025C4CF4E|nr:MULTISPECIES: helix-turn-helix domain-containing protein [unclassified Brevundimonas]
MPQSTLAPTLLSLLAVQGVDAGDAIPAQAGQHTAPVRNGERQVTLILVGVAARLGADQRLCRGLAGSGELINFDAAMGENDDETALWLTPGRFVSVPATWLIRHIDAEVLTATALADLRARNAALQTELARHATLKVAQRLAALLLDITTRDGIDQISLRQSDLADLMAVRRASISVASTELCAAGAIRLRRAAIQVIDPDALRRLAEEPHSTVTDLARLRG